MAGTDDKQLLDFIGLAKDELTAIYEKHSNWPPKDFDGGDNTPPIS